MEQMRTKQDWYESAPWIDNERLHIEEYVGKLKPSERPIYNLKQKLEEWRERGVVIFEGVVDPTLIDRVNKDLEHVFANHQRYRIVIDGSDDVFAKFHFLDKLTASQLREFNIKLVDIHKMSYNSAMLSMVPEAVSFLRHIFGNPPALMQSLTFRRGSEQPLHQDFPYVFQQREIAKLAAFWIPLEDIHPDSGPLAYYWGSHKVDTVGFFDWGGGAINQFDRINTTDKFNAYGEFLANTVVKLGLTPHYFLPKKGDLLIWHGALIHAGSKIRNPGLTRKSFVGHYTTLSNHFALEPNRFGGGFLFDVPAHKEIAAFERDPSDITDLTQHGIKKLYWALHGRLNRRAGRKGGG